MNNAVIVNVHVSSSEADTNRDLLITRQHLLDNYQLSLKINKIIVTNPGLKRRLSTIYGACTGLCK